MTRSTSDVAVCCSNDSVSSRVRCCSASNSRTFSIAITALVGESRDQLDLLVGKGPNLGTRQGQDTHRDALAQQRDAEHRAVGTQLLRLLKGVIRIDFERHGYERFCPQAGPAPVHVPRPAVIGCTCVVSARVPESP